MTAPIRVLVVDDSVVIRRLLTAIIEDDPDLEVAGVAANGKIALQRVRQLQPDIVTLDVEMPELDGLETLAQLRPDHPDLPIVMFSTLTERGASATLEALGRGASDYVAKPANVGSVNAGIERVRSDLVPKLKALCRSAQIAEVEPIDPPADLPAPSGRVELVAIGSSTGGPNALAAVLGDLPGDLEVPVVVVQHMPPVFTQLLAERLDAAIGLTVHEAVGGEIPAPGHAYIAPGDHHLVVRRTARGLQLAINQEPPEHFCRPAVDVLFRSVRDAVGGDAIATVLTGMGSDGRDGAATLRELGARVLAQDRATSVVWGMPGAVATSGLADEVLPLDLIGPRIAEHVRAAQPARARSAS